MLEKWQETGLKFERFSLDQGWMDYSSDTTRFAPLCCPDGPRRLVARAKAYDQLREVCEDD
jgi:hypothetical protein